MNSSMLASVFTLSNSNTDAVHQKYSENGDVDFLARVSGTTATTLTTKFVGETKDFAYAIQRYAYDRRIEVESLLHAINWQHKTIEFNSSYIAMLLGQIDDDEFEAVAESLAAVKEEKTPSQIVPILSSLLRLTKIPFTASDFAGMLNCSEETVLHAINAIACNQEASSHLSE